MSLVCEGRPGCMGTDKIIEIVYAGENIDKKIVIICGLLLNNKRYLL